MVSENASSTSRNALGYQFGSLSKDAYYHGPSSSLHFLAKNDMMLPCPFCPAFFGFAACAEGAELAVFGLVAGGGSSSEKDSHPGS
jgi:hypothetical protein